MEFIITIKCVNEITLQRVCPLCVHFIASKKKDQIKYHSENIKTNGSIKNMYVCIPIFQWMCEAVCVCVRGRWWEKSILLFWLRSFSISGASVPPSVVSSLTSMPPDCYWVRGFSHWFSLRAAAGPALCCIPGTLTDRMDFSTQFLWKYWLHFLIIPPPSLSSLMRLEYFANMFLSSDIVNYFLTFSSVKWTQEDDVNRMCAHFLWTECFFLSFDLGPCQKDSEITVTLL